jgi:4-diphosphocytidyl-2-C-methyl-D-erythritol kinase
MIAADLGADVSFFLLGGTACAAGIGSQLTQLADAPEKFLLIVKPNANISTAAGYKAWDEHSLTMQKSKTILSSSQRADNLHDAALPNVGNDFEAVAFDLEPEIFRAKAALSKAGAQTVLLAGSGSAVFGIFDSEDAQRRATQAIEVETGWRVFPCKTIGHESYWAALADAAA